MKPTNLLIISLTMACLVTGSNAFATSTAATSRTTPSLAGKQLAACTACLSKPAPLPTANKATKVCPPGKKC